jgi:hypothetical protein
MYSPVAKISDLIIRVSQILRFSFTANNPVYIQISELA